jgi:hypothetical protein
MVCWIMAIIMATPCHHYFDDYMVVGAESTGESGQDALHALHNTLHLPMLDGGKHKKAAKQNRVLGVECDMSRAHEGVVEMRPCQKRACQILEALRSCKDRNNMAPSQAAKLLGKLNFLVTGLFGRMGRAAMLPLVQRTVEAPYEGEERWPWTEAMSRMLEFLSVILAAGALQPRKFFLKEDQMRGHVVIYTDASYTADGVKGLGVVLWDPMQPEQKFFCSAECPPWILEEFNDDFIICQLELLAALCAVLTFQEAIRGRRVVLFIDNMSALSAIVNGYTGQTHMALLSNMFHTVLAALQVDLWSEWVPSKANIADVPSRPDQPEKWTVLEGMERVPLVFPTREQWNNHSLFLAMQIG